MTPSRSLSTRQGYGITFFAVVACATGCGGKLETSGSAPSSTPCQGSEACPTGLACHAGVCTDQTPPRSGLVGWWTFDGPGLKAVDKSGNGNDGTVQGNVTQVPGRVGLAYSLDGGCIGVPNSPSLAMDGRNQLTVMAWVQAANACGSAIDNCEILNKEETYEMGQGSGSATSVQGGFGEAIQRADGYWFWNEEQPDVIPTGAWLHVAVTWDGNTVTRYVNGTVLDDPSNPRSLDSSSSLAARTTGLGIGCRSVAANGSIAGVPLEPTDYSHGLAPFRGIIDEAAVYNRALTGAEIAAYYAATN